MFYYFKKKLFFVFVFVVVATNCMSCYADEAEVMLNIMYPGNHGDHVEHYAPADIPEVYYDNDTYEIILVSDGFSSYYDVVIIRDTPYQTVISTQVSGYGGSIDISSLSEGNYTIVITSEFLNEFEGQFTII